jgi:predicted ferric reductase
VSDQVWWYVARASGIVAWVTMAAGIFWGLALSSRFLGRRPKPNWMLDLHRFLGGLAVVLIAIHLASLVADSYVSFGWLDVLVPGAASYQPAAVAWGVVGLYLAVAVEVTSLLRKRLSRRAWRMTHLLSYPLFAVATMHLLQIGTDRHDVVLRLGVPTVALAIALATLVRIVRAPAPVARATRIPPRVTSAPPVERSLHRTEVTR